MAVKPRTPLRLLHRIDPQRFHPYFPHRRLTLKTPRNAAKRKDSAYHMRGPAPKIGKAEFITRPVVVAASAVKRIPLAVRWS